MATATATHTHQDFTARLMVGMEIHVELGTRSKMFTAAPNVAHPDYFEASPNSLCDPVVLGMPGVLPVINRRAVEMAMLVGLALGCKIARYTKWDRKSYYYPDLPKNYQISQYDQPLCEEGAVEIPIDGATGEVAGTKTIRIIRAHLEEDAGKLLHEAPGGHAIDGSIVDLNRAGTPLLEIVTYPDFDTPEQVVTFAQMLRNICRFLGVSEGIMQRGHIRFEPNINVVIQRGGQTYKTPIVEIKNLNSFKAVHGAVRHEYERQIEAWLETGVVMKPGTKSTRGWDDDSQSTFLQREKEEADDYRYFPDPDLVPVVVDDAWLERIRAQLPELPLARQRRYIEKLGLNPKDARTLVDEAKVCLFFEGVLAEGIDPKRASALLLNNLARRANDKGVRLDELGATPKQVAQIAELAAGDKIGSAAVDTLLGLCCDNSGTDAMKLAEANGLLQVSDQGALDTWVDQAIAANPKSVEAVKGGKEAAISALVGAVMKLSKGKANAKVVQEKLRKKLLGDGMATEKALQNTSRSFRFSSGGIALLLALLLTAAHGAVPATQPSKTLFERSYQVRLADAPAGWGHATEIETPASGGREALIESKLDMSVTIKRGAATLTVRLISHFTETADGRPVSAGLRQELGAAAMEQEFTFERDGLEMVSRQGGTENHQKLALPAPQGQVWLTPLVALRYMRQQIAKGAKEISYWSFDPASGPDLVQTTMRFVSKEKVAVVGKVVAASLWDETASVMPRIVTRNCLDDDAQPVKSDMPLIPGTVMEMIEADKDLALTPRSPPELLAGTLLTPEGRIDHPRTLRRGVYDIAIRAEEGAPPARPAGEVAALIPTLGVQLATLMGQPASAPGHPSTQGVDHVRVEVDLASPVTSGPAGTAPEFLQASVMLNYHDPVIRELLDKALHDQPAGLSPAAKAEVLRRFVHAFITEKDLSVGMATASEVARTAEGDCTEHAVLLAALLRAAGIPSRTVTGLAYADEFLGKQGVFGYHMWTEAWLPAEGKSQARWVDLDATLSADDAFDATHIALGASAMSDEGMTNDLVRLVPLLGRLGIRVLEPAAIAAVPATPPTPAPAPTK